MANIGDYLYGGIVFYTWNSGNNGLISAMYDLSVSINEGEVPGAGYIWGCQSSCAGPIPQQYPPENPQNNLKTGIGDGYENTYTYILPNCTESTIAARMCSTYGYSNSYIVVLDENSFIQAQNVTNRIFLSGYTLTYTGNTWYLPSRDELDLLYTNRYLIGNFKTDYLSNIYGSCNSYWSSTETNDGLRVYSKNFYNGYDANDRKHNTYFGMDVYHRVRAIRSF